MNSDLTVREFEAIAGHIYKHSGIRFELGKQYYVSKRVAARMEATRCQTVDEYVRLLTASKAGPEEFQQLITLVTTNESYFFRDFDQLAAFAEHCLPEVIERKVEEGDNRLRIWSAGCSSGEEPYTIAIILREMLGDIGRWNIDILATDIDQNILNKARIGVYEPRSAKEVPPEYLERYFVNRGDQYYLNSDIKAMVEFRNMNLNDQAQMRRMRGFDFIFCRNVLIYFDDQSRKRVVDNFYLSMEKGGYVFLGSSESIGRISNAFTLCRRGNYLVYRK